MRPRRTARGGVKEEKWQKVELKKKTIINIAVRVDDPLKKKVT